MVIVIFIKKIEKINYGRKFNSNKFYNFKLNKV